MMAESDLRGIKFRCQYFDYSLLYIQCSTCIVLCYEYVSRETSGFVITQVLRRRKWYWKVVICV